MLNKNCLTCGKSFTVKNYLKRVKFCCKKCVRFSQKIKNKLSKQRKGVPKTEVWKKSASLGKMSEKNPQWKGNNAGLSAIHIWVLRNKPKPKYCVDCKKKPPIDLANISQKYKRDVNDFEWLCRKCHMIKDGRMKKLLKTTKDRSLPKLKKICWNCQKIYFSKREKSSCCSHSCAVYKVNFIRWGFRKIIIKKLTI